MKKIEFLFPEFCYIYAESYNIEYLSRCSNEIEIIRTDHHTTPSFVKNDVDMVYLGSLTEVGQEYVINLLMPYKERIIELIDKGTIFLLTGNAIEIFSKYIKVNDRVINCLGIFDTYVERNLDSRRINAQFVGLFNDITILGHVGQYSYMYGENNYPLFNIEKGFTMNPNVSIEGIHYKNVFATYSLGPFLVLNPYFTKYLLKLLDINTNLPFEKEAIEAYEYRKKELIDKL